MEGSDPLGLTPQAEQRHPLAPFSRQIEVIFPIHEQTHPHLLSRLAQRQHVSPASQAHRSLTLLSRRLRLQAPPSLRNPLLRLFVMLSRRMLKLLLYLHWTTLRIQFSRIPLGTTRLLHCRSSAQGRAPRSHQPLHPERRIPDLRLQGQMRQDLGTERSSQSRRVAMAIPDHNIRIAARSFTCRMGGVTMVIIFLLHRLFPAYQAHMATCTGKILQHRKILRKIKS